MSVFGVAHAPLPWTTYLHIEYYFSVTPVQFFVAAGVSNSVLCFRLASSLQGGHFLFRQRVTLVAHELHTGLKDHDTLYLGL